MTHGIETSLDPSMQTAIEQMTRFAIDQVVVNGEVDGRDRRVARAVLFGVAFQDGTVAPEVAQAFETALVTEPRFINQVEDLYSYKPEVDPRTHARPSMMSMVQGRAICSEQEQQDCLSFLDRYSGIVYHRLAPEKVVPSRADMDKLLTAGDHNLSKDQLNALYIYINQDARFISEADAATASQPLQTRRYRSALEKKIKGASGSHSRHKGSGRRGHQ